LGRNWIPIQHNVAWSDIYLRTKRYLDPSSRLATIDMGRKLGAVCLLGGAGSPSNTMWHGPRPTSVPSGILIHPAVRPQYMGRKVGGCCHPVFWGYRPQSPSNTMSPGPRPTSVSSGILIQPAAWPQQTWAENWGLCPFGCGR